MKTIETDILANETTLQQQLEIIQQFCTPSIYDFNEDGVNELLGIATPYDILTHVYYGNINFSDEYIWIDGNGELESGDDNLVIDLFFEETLESYIDDILNELPWSEELVEEYTKEYQEKYSDVQGQYSLRY